MNYYELLLNSTSPRPILPAGDADSEIDRLHGLLIASRQQVERYRISGKNLIKDNILILKHKNSEIARLQSVIRAQAATIIELQELIYEIARKNHEMRM